MKFIDLTGQRFGRLTVLEVTDKRVKGSGNIIWKCQCDCGNIIEASNTRLKYNNIQSCGCIRKEKAKNKRKEYIGKIFGKLVILGEADTSSDKKIIFRCQCDCGNIYEASLNALKSGKRISCGCFQPEKPVEDFSGQRFGNLIVLENTNKRAGGGNRNYIWKCKCDCGNIIGAAASDLKNGFTKCCGCTDSESIVYNVDDLTGQRFGRLVILGEAEQETSSTSIGGTIWRCQCDCGNIVDLSYNTLKLGNTKSCGCLHKEAIKKNYKDLTGHRFGMLTVIEMTDKRVRSSVVWKCRCDCGNIIEMPAYNLRQRNNHNCGCLYKIN